MVPYGQTRTDELKVGMKNPRLIATALISTFYLIFAGSACIPNNAPVQDAEQTAGSAENALQEFTFTIEPAEGTTQIALRTNLRITFNQAMDAATLTTHTSTVCSGSVQLSRDNFISCAAMQASAPQMSQGNTVAEFTPIDGMAGAFNHKVRLTTEIRATNGAALKQTYTQADGFTPDNISQCRAHCEADRLACGGEAGPETELGAYCLELRDMCLGGCN